MPELSIAIVLHNSADGLVECLASIGEAVEQGFAELIAVDNASPDNSVAILRRELPTAKVVELDKNRGFAAGANAAISQAAGDYWLLLNPDVRVPQRGLEILVAWMDAHVDVGIASPDIVGTDGAWESPGRAFPSISRTLLELSRLHRLLSSRVRGRILRGPYWPGGDQLNAGWVPGTAMIIRPDAARQVGPLHDDLFMYGEDIELCWRMHRAGWKVGVCSSTRFVHQRSSSTKRTFGASERDRHVAEGVDRACRAMYGTKHARLLAVTSALSLWTESLAPGRSTEHRRRAVSAAHAWWQLALHT